MVSANDSENRPTTSRGDGSGSVRARSGDVRLTEADAPALHNPSVDEDAARAGACAQVHLPTGSMCTQPRGHAGSCAFVPADEARAALARARALHGR